MIDLTNLITREIKAKRSQSNFNFVNGTVGKSFGFYAMVSNPKSLSLKRCKVDHITIYKKCSKKGDFLSNKPYATYDCDRGIRPNYKKASQLVGKIIFNLEWNLKY